MVVALICSFEMRAVHFPISSYRLQLSAQFGFEDAARALPYLHELGITDCYSSPILKASPGSTHGYDIVDHGVLNAELGTTDEFDTFAESLKQRQMGLILDFVPNHMGLDPSANVWWRDVLEHGQGSPYADYFDIDWDPVTPEIKGRLLLPILQDGYGEVLHRGDLRVGFDAGSFHLEYFDRRLPIEPRSSAAVMRAGLTAQPQELQVDSAERREYLNIAALLEMLAQAPSSDPNKRLGRQQITQLAHQRLAQLAGTSPLVRTWIDAALASLNGTPGESATFDRLHDLLEHQPYRLANWRTAFDEINYRRFFDVNDLGALRMEDPCVFASAHALVLRLIAEGQVTGLRIDHADGLLDPAAYFTRLEREAAVAMAGPHDSPPDRFYIVAEKILAHDELLPQDWPIAGTTGYGFLNAVNGVFVDSAHKEAFRRLWSRIKGQGDSFGEVAYHGKRLVMGSSMASELTVLARALKTIANSDRRTRDFTLTALRKAIVEVVACFPVYRTYVRASGFSAADRERIDLAVDRARSRNPVMAQTLFLFLRSVLLAEGDEHDEQVRARRQFAMKFQQFTVPVQAKGVEDTSFYRDTALASLNEVGGDPARFGTTVEEFHAGNRVRLERWPRELLATATHDTKRGEDVRARLNVLSEMPIEWKRTVSDWRRRNAVHRTAVDRKSAPDAADEYAFYQALVGSWPAEPMDAPMPTEAPPALVVRLREYMQKAIKEAKTHTSWINQNAAYEDAVSRFVETTLSGSAGQAFLAGAVPFIRRIAAAGMVNSLAQLVLKVASPGVPDFFQGTETWQLAMADPDNRQPVDFACREAMLGALMPLIRRAESADRDSSSDCELERQVAGLLASWPDARIKMFVTACALRLRRRAPAVFIEGRYEALRADGPRASHVVGFARVHETMPVIVAVPRLMNQLLPAGRSLPTGADAWEGTRLVLPPGQAGAFRHLFTGARIRAHPSGEYLDAADVFRTCPVAILMSERDAE
jgi:(1->4)-alpha-D-glucan 1-alpha-D-glucosylmutase